MFRTPKRFTRTTVLATVLIFTVSSPLLAAKGGKGKPGGGGEDPPATRPVNYVVTWFEAFDSTITYAWDVNKYGEIVGSYIDAHGDLQPFLYTPLDGMQNLNTLIGRIEAAKELETGLPIDLRQGHRLRAAIQINGSSRIVGTCSDGIGDRSIYVFDETLDPCLQFVPLSGFGYTFPFDLTEDGWVVGYADSSAGDRISFACTPTVGCFPLPIDFQAQGISSLGDVVGIKSDRTLPRYSIASNSTVPLADLAWGPVDSNDLGEVVAYVPGPKNRNYPQVYRDGAWQHLGSAPYHARPTKINNGGQVCGTLDIRDSKLPDTCFIYDPVDGYWSIDDLVDGKLDDVLLWFSGDGGNDAVPKGMSESDGGYPIIVGEKRFSDGTMRGFVLTPSIP